MIKEEIVNRYDLSGGSDVTVHKPFGSSYYIALVSMGSGAFYPSTDSVAHNVSRVEYIVVEQGSMKLTHNGNELLLNAGHTATISDGDTYSIEAVTNMRAIVFVHDEENGETEVLPR